MSLKSSDRRREAAKDLERRLKDEVRHMDADVVRRSYATNTICLTALGHAVLHHMQARTS